MIMFPLNLWTLGVDETLERFSDSIPKLRLKFLARDEILYTVEWILF